MDCPFKVFIINKLMNTSTYKINFWIELLTLIQPGSRTSISRVRSRVPLPVFAYCVIERYSFVNLPRTVQRQLYTKKDRKRAGLTENPPPPVLYMAWDQKLIRKLIGAAPHSGPRPGRNSPTLRWSAFAVKPIRRGGGVSSVLLQPDFWWKNINEHRNVLFDVISEVERIWKTFLQE